MVLGGDEGGGLGLYGPLLFGPCVRVERYTFTLIIELTSPTGGTAGHESGKSEIVSATNRATGPQTGQVDAFGIPRAPVTRSGSAVSFSLTETGPESGIQMEFKGTLSGDVIGGTVTMIRRVPNLTGTVGEHAPGGAGNPDPPEIGKRRPE